MRNTLPSISVVIEWENARLSEMGRAKEMLRRLSEQIEEVTPSLASPPELLVLHEADVIETAFLGRIVGESFGGDGPAEVRLIPTEGLSYYTQKNRGAAEACNELIVFLDSDVIPEPGWLRGLIEPFQNPNVEIVCGNSYIDATSLYSKAFALFWFFPLRLTADEFRAVTYFFANNVAFRRELFLAYGFPAMPSQRRQCVALAEALQRDGHQVYLQPHSQVSHPPPNGLAHFVRRALSHGHELMVLPDRKARRLGSPWLRALDQTCTQLFRSTGRVVLRYREVGLSPVGVVGAVGIALTYYTLFFIGTLVTIVKPELIPRRFGI